MKSKEIKELIDFIAGSGLDEVNLETDEIKLHVKRSAKAPKQIVEVSSAPVGMPAMQPMAAAPFAAPVQAAVPAAPVTETPSATVSDESNYVTVKSPMIGTFYRSPNPEADIFVNVGDSIKKGHIVCIIEAMKLFNEIEAEVSGKIVKVLVDNASPVEYDQPLFLVDPS